MIVGAPLLSAIIFLPLLGAVGIGLLPSSRPASIRLGALVVSLATFALSLAKIGRAHV